MDFVDFLGSGQIDCRVASLGLSALRILRLVKMTKRFTGLATTLFSCIPLGTSFKKYTVAAAP